ncbi:MAG: DegT/DnrJ/EryC1/StrS family aminotransferase [Actinobacteria bacterium]|nr:DegT/DnrJ/EryC1/StrS family aminotransferase [Actinomycetota bacterium]
MVPVVDLSRHAPELVAQYLERVRQVLARGTVLLGPETEAFEHELATWADAPGSVSVSSGAGALQLTLAALGVGPGDEVIVPAFTAVPTASAVCALGATPVFADVDPTTASIDANSVDAVRTDRTKAVVVVHLYGRPAELPGTDLPIVEDAAQAMGALERHDASAAVAYSFYPTKNLGGIGDGGAVVSADADLLERVRRLRVHGMTQQYVHEWVSQNFRMSEIEAAWLRLGLPLLDRWNEARRDVSTRYRAAAPGLRWHADHERHVQHLCVFRTSDRDRTRARLADLGVGTGVHYPLALTQQPAYRHLTRRPCPEAEAWASECVSLPCFPQMTADEVDTVAAALATIHAEGLA